MVQANTVLLKPFALKGWIASSNTNCRSRPDVVEQIRAIIYLSHAELRQKAAVKFMRLIKLTDSQNHMRHSVDFDHLRALDEMIQRVNIIEAPHTRRSKTSGLGSILFRLTDYVRADNL